MDQEQASVEAQAAPMESLQSMSEFYGPAATAVILRAWADMLDEIAQQHMRLN